MLITDDFPNLGEKVDKLLPITNEYNFFDLLKAVFCINICINNRSTLESGLALNESIVDYRPLGDKRITTYEEFYSFFYKIEPVLKPTMMDDYTVEDFGDVKIRYNNKIYKIILGTGHNQVFACINYLPFLADMTNHNDDLKVLMTYYSGIIEYFEGVNKNDLKECVRFEIPSLELFERVQIFFRKEIKQYDILHISEILNRESMLIEKRHFVEREDNLYPLYNVAMLVDVCDRWIYELDDKQRITLTNKGIVYLVNDLLKLDLRENPKGLFPVKLFKNGKPVDDSGTYTFVANCKNGTIIALNSDEYSNQKLTQEISMIEKMHGNNELCFVETISNRENKQHQGVTILKDNPIKFILYNSQINIEEMSMTFGEREEKHLKCSALDMIYMLQFMDDFEELYDYLEYEWENDFEQMMAFGGDSTKFLSWKNQNHMFAKGAIKFGMIDLGYNTENDYVVNYYKNKLQGYPWKSNDFMFKNSFSWKIRKLDNGYYEYVNKYAMGFGGKLKYYDNSCTLYFVHNMEFYIKTDTINQYMEIIPFTDDLNIRLIKECENIFEKSELFSNKCIEVIFMPKEYALSVIGHSFFETERQYVYSDMNILRDSICIRYAVEIDKLYHDISEANNRKIETIYFKELFKPFERRFINEYNSLVGLMDKVSLNKKLVDTFEMKIEYFWNDKRNTYYVHDKAFFEVKKNIAVICQQHNIQPGVYYGKDANGVIRTMQKALIEDFENMVSRYAQADIHSRTLEIYADTVHSINVHRVRYNSFNDVEENVLEEIHQRIIADREGDKHHARSLLYLIETNIFLNLDCDGIASKEQFEYLLAYANWLVVLNDSADILHFTEDEAYIEVTFEYVVDVLENEDRSDKFGNIQQRVYDDTGYTLSGGEEDFQYIEKLKQAFKQDTGLELINLFDFMDYLQMHFSQVEALEIKSNVYSIERSRIINSFIEIMENNVTIEETDRMLSFLTVNPLELKTCNNKTDFYLPIGQRKFRNNRFEIKPIWEDKGKIVFAPPVINDTHLKWRNGTLDFYLPYEVGLNRTKAIIVEWKAMYEKKIVYDIENIFRQNGYDFVKTNLELRKIDKENHHPQKLGDYDIFVIDSFRKEIWTIECKFLEKVGSFYEMYRQQNRFFKEHREDEMFQIRIDYMKEHYKKILNFYKFDLSEAYEVVPYIVMNKVLVSRYKQLQFPIISFGELETVIRERKT